MTKRCGWCGNDPLYVDYHDNEWGVPVRDGVNGFALPTGSQADAFADIVARYESDPAAYNTLRASTRQEFEDHLNWEAWGRRVAQLLQDQSSSQQL